MLQKPESQRPSRTRKREEFLNAVSRLVGSLSIVVMVATLFYVVIQNLLVPPPTDKATLEAIYGSDSVGSNWSGDKSSQPALFQTTRAAAAPITTDGTQQNRETVEQVINSVTQARQPDDLVPKAQAVIAGISNIEAKRPQIEQAVRLFFDATTVEGKLKLVRDADRVRPLMEGYYRREKMPTYQWQNIGWTLPVDEPGYRFGYVQANFSDAPPVSMIVEEMEDGSFRVDWESSVRYGELAWQDFLRMKPAQPTLFRVIASKVESTLVPNAVAQHTEAGGEVIEIKHPAEEGVVYAALNKNDPQLAPVISQMQTGKWKDVPLTLRLCYPGPSASKGDAVRIAGVEGKGWLILQPNRS
jgi:hypothetical protein